MSDDFPTASPPPPPEGAGWSSPPQSAAPPPPPPVDSTGQVPVPLAAPVATGPSRPPFTLDNPLGLGLGIVAVVGVVLGLILKSTVGGSSAKLWDTMGWAWAVLAIAAAVAALLPALGSLVGLSAALAAKLAAIGAGFLVLWWVLFVLPVIQLNTGFLATVGVLAAVGAAWTAHRGVTASAAATDADTP